MTSPVLPSRSVALPLPSSPHWAPTSTIAGISALLFTHQPHTPWRPVLETVKPGDVHRTFIRQRIQALATKAYRTRAPRFRACPQPSSDRFKLLFPQLTGCHLA